jgi:hypothetical protein
MNLSETIKLIIEQLSLLCCNSTLFLILIVFSVLALDIFTIKGLTLRIKSAKLKSQRRLLIIFGVLWVVILAIFLPGFLANAIAFVILSNFVTPILVILASILIIISLPIILLGILIKFGPRILRWLWSLISAYGERLLHFIENSPSPLISNFRQAFGNASTQLILRVNRLPWPDLLSDPTISNMVKALGLSSDSLYMQIAHDPNAPENKQFAAIRWLGERDAERELYCLGMDVTASYEIRSLAVHQLQLRRHYPTAVRIWDTIGKDSTNPNEQLDAVEHLLCLPSSPQATLILDSIFTEINELSAVQKIRAWYLHALIHKDPIAYNSIENISIHGDDLGAFINGATALFLLRERARAEALLVSIATDPARSSGARRRAITHMQRYCLDQALIKVLNNPYVDLNMRYRTSLALQNCGNIPWAIRGFRRIAQDTGNPTEDRISASMALAILDQTRSTKDILWQLACSSALTGAEREGVALAMWRGGWKTEARQILVEVIGEPNTDDYTRRSAQRNLVRIQSPDFGLPE